MKGVATMEPVLSLRHINKSFGKRRVINDLSFDVYPGEVFGFLGPNGAGKTTTIKMVMGFLRIDSGEVIIDGIDVKKDYEGAMSRLGGIVENPEMYKNLSGRKNLEMYARLHNKLDRHRIDEVTALVGMTERIDDKVKRYSLGMKQRVGLAQALVPGPGCLSWMSRPTASTRAVSASCAIYSSAWPIRRGLLSSSRATCSVRWS